MGYYLSVLRAVFGTYEIYNKCNEYIQVKKVAQTLSHTEQTQSSYFYSGQEKAKDITTKCSKITFNLEQ